MGVDGVGFFVVGFDNVDIVMGNVFEVKVEIVRFGRDDEEYVVEMVGVFKFG